MKRRFYKNWKKRVDQNLNKNEGFICVKEKALDKLRYRNTKIKRIKIKDSRIRNNKLFQEDQGIFY